MFSPTGWGIFFGLIFWVAHVVILSHCRMTLTETQHTLGRINMKPLIGMALLKSTQVAQLVCVYEIYTRWIGF
jgi:hypothetical protein